MPRPEKGSPEAKQWAADMRAKRLAKEAEIQKVIKETTKGPVKLSPSSVDAGIMQPSGDTSPRGTIIRQISQDEAIAQLDEMDVQEWVKYHYDKGDFNIQSMGEVLRESTEEIYNRLHAAGANLPAGTYSA